MTQEQIDVLLEAKEKYFDPQTKLAGEMIEADPSLNTITALIRAGDQLSRKRADEAVAEGTPVLLASIFVGSFSRFDWIVEQYFMENIEDEDFFQEICELWRGADPNDTDPVFLTVWEEAYNWNGEMLRDDDTKFLPSGDPITIYRGQLTFEEPMGVSWSLSKDIATKFSHGASIRAYVENGVLLEALVDKRDIIAYITGRGEEEIIINPTNVRLV
jgi:hypothetical protein